MDKITPVEACAIVGCHADRFRQRRMKSNEKCSEQAGDFQGK
jgi:hypothetical protein